MRHASLEQKGASVTASVTHNEYQCHLMTGYTKFAVVGAGALGNYIVQQLLKEKAAGIVKEVVVLTREVQYPPAPLLLQYDVILLSTH